MFVYNTNEHLIGHALDELAISKEKVIEMLSYKCPKQPACNAISMKYHKYSLLGRLVALGTFEHLQRLIAFVGKQAFVDNIFNLDGDDKDGLYHIIRMKNMKILEFMFHFDEVREKYNSGKEDLFSLVETLNEFIENKEIVEYVVETLAITKEALEELNAFRSIDISKVLPFTK